MGKIISFMYISLDGFIAGPNGEMNWIKVDEEIFDHVSRRISGVFIVPRWRATTTKWEETKEQVQEAKDFIWEHIPSLWVVFLVSFQTNKEK